MTIGTEQVITIPVINTRDKSVNDTWDKILDEDSGSYYYQHKETLETIEILKTIPFVKTLILENKLLKQENQILKSRVLRKDLGKRSS